LKTKSEYPKLCWDIEFSEIDNKNLSCVIQTHFFQYFSNSGGLEYEEGEKLALKEFTEEKYKSKSLKMKLG
jgi:hypothetical protein